MPRLTRIYTRGGDEGTTSLGVRQRVAKSHPRVAAFGDVDELNSQLGVVLAAGPSRELVEALGRIQNDLFHLGSDLCVLEQDKKRMPVPQIEAGHVEALETEIDRMSADLGPLENFILPGGTEGAARLHLARTICRRAERLVTALSRDEKIGVQIIPYLNRLSDALFVMARWENHGRGVTDIYWKSRA